MGTHDQAFIFGGACLSAALSHRLSFCLCVLIYPCACGRASTRAHVGILCLRCRICNVTGAGEHGTRRRSLGWNEEEEEGMTVTRFDLGTPQPIHHFAASEGGGAGREALERERGGITVRDGGAEKEGLVWCCAQLDLILAKYPCLHPCAFLTLSFPLSLGVSLRCHCRCRFHY